MAWTAIFQDAIQRDGRLCFSIVYTDGTQKVLREYVADVLDDAAVQATARSEISRFDSVTVSKGKLTFQSGATIDTSPVVVVVVPPTAAEQARDAWLSDWSLYRRLKALADAGIILPTDKRLTDAQARIAANWLDAYLPLVSLR